MLINTNIIEKHKIYWSKTCILNHVNYTKNDLDNISSKWDNDISEDDSDTEVEHLIEMNMDNDNKITKQIIEMNMDNDNKITKSLINLTKEDELWIFI